MANTTPPTTATFETFAAELTRLVDAFAHNLPEHKNPRYVEAQLRDDFLNPFFAALGWDIANQSRLIQSKREVEIESRTQIAGRQKRADYLFRVDSRDRFVCEAKKPAEELHARHSFQAKRYAWNKQLPLAILTDFEEIKLFIVGGKPHIGDSDIGLYKKFHFKDLPANAKEIWDLLARDSVAAGSIEKLIESLPKKPAGKGKYKQGWLIKPDRSRSLDVEFLNTLDEARRELAQDLLKQNDREDLLEGNRLNEATQRILDRILFLRICEDRDIDTGLRLDSILQTWRRATGRDDGPRRQSSLELHDEPPVHYGSHGLTAPKDSLWRSVVRHFRHLDRRPPSHVPFFNGNLFKHHFSEELTVSDEFLAGFIGELSDDESAYLFAYIPVEILGTIYERFLGKVVRPHGRGVVIEEKPEVRKAGGVYYTPRYIVEYIVAQTVEKLLAEKKPEDTLKLRFLDPACGSGSFLIRVFEATCEYWQQYLTTNPAARKKKWCWTEKNKTTAAEDVHLTMSLKRQILLSNIYGVDLDPGAVEVTQLSLYLKMLENENRNTLQTQRDLLPEDDDPLLPPLENNIKCGNSLIASDFSMIPDELVRVRAFDWNVAFREIMKGGGFDAVVGNPPYLCSAGQHDIAYYKSHYDLSEYQTDFYTYFIEKALSLTRRLGRFSFIVSDSWLKAQNFSKLRAHLLRDHNLDRVVVFRYAPFEGATIENSILVISKSGRPERTAIDTFTRPGKFQETNVISSSAAADRGLIDPRFSEAAAAVIEKMGEETVTLETLLELNRGIHAYRTDGYGISKFGSGPQTKRDKDERSYHSDQRLNKTYYPELKGKDVFRFDFVPSGEFVSYGEWLAEPREPKYFLNPKIALRKVLGPRLHGTYLSDPVVLDQSLYVAISSCGDEKTLKHVLGILLSSIGAWYLRTKFAIYDTLYPWYTRKQLAEFPIKPVSDKLVQLTDKLLVLTPKLRTTKSDHERQTLQNAVTATDQQIDALVYELYGLSEDEIKIVEGNA